MEAVEVVLILIGVAFLVGSFFVTEKLSQEDVERISLMSEGDLKHIADKQVKEVRTQIENSIEELIEDTVESTKRGLEKETNNKIMAVSEYSDTVLETMNKTHNEIMFLYSMLNDKHAETADIVNDLQKYAKQIRDFDMEATLAKIETAKKQEVKPAVEETQKSEMLPDDTYVDNINIEETASNNKNEQILLLYKEGKTEVEIAKALDCGLGEVRLVIGLYNEA